MLRGRQILHGRCRRRFRGRFRGFALLPFEAGHLRFQVAEFVAEALNFFPQQASGGARDHECHDGHPDDGRSQAEEKQSNEFHREKKMAAL
jgi:hypothetical protein